MHRAVHRCVPSISLSPERIGELESFIQRMVENGWNILVKAVPGGAGQILRAQGEPAFSSWGEEIVVLKVFEWRTPFHFRWAWREERL